MEIYGVVNNNTALASACGPLGVQAKLTSRDLIAKGLIINAAIVGVECKPTLSLGGKYGGSPDAQGLLRIVAVIGVIRRRMGPVSARMPHFLQDAVEV